MGDHSLQRAERFSFGRVMYDRALLSVSAFLFGFDLRCGQQINIHLS
jgi:hypothetical protein